MSAQGPLITIREFAELTGMSRAAARAVARREDTPGLFVGERFYFLRADVDAILANLSANRVRLDVEEGGAWQ